MFERFYITSTHKDEALVIHLVFPLQVPGQRLVYRFHKLPYEFRPSFATNIKVPSTWSPGRRTRDSSCCDEHRSGGTAAKNLTRRPCDDMTTKAIADKVAVTDRPNGQGDLNRNEGEREIPSPPDSMESMPAPQLSYRPAFPSSLRSPVFCSCRSQSFKQQAGRAGCFVMYPPYAPVRDNFPALFNAVMKYRSPVPVSVITKTRY